MISDFHCLPTLISSRCLWQILDCVNVNDADWQKIQELFAKERQWRTSQMQMHIREVNSMFADERKKVRERYKEYDGCYLGHYAQWFFWFLSTQQVSRHDEGSIRHLFFVVYGPLSLPVRRNVYQTC